MFGSRWEYGFSSVGGRSLAGLYSGQVGVSAAYLVGHPKV
jgi:hypothetical protein